MRSFRPMRPRREALPALLAMALIALVGLLLTRGLTELIPEELFETSPFGGLTAEDIEIDPATGLPIVPTALHDEVITWSIAQPNSRIVASNTWASDDPAGTTATERPSVTLLAKYPTHQEALVVARELAAAVADPGAEAAWLEAADVDPGAGFGWVGPEGSSTPFVQVVDRRLLVDGLEWNEAYEPLAETEPVEGLSYRAPLALALEASATSVLVEGDRGGEGAIAFDLVCTGDPGALLSLGQELADAPYARPARPPWMDPALTFEEQRARRTGRLVAQMWAAAFIQDVMRSDEMERLSRNLARATEAGDEAAMAATSAAMQAHLAELVPLELPDLGPLGDAIDPDQLAASMAELSGAGSDTATSPPAPDPDEPVVGWRDGSAAYEVLAQNRRLWVTQGSWFGVAQGFGPFVGYLETNGCDDIQVVFHDYDDVRGD